MSNRTKLLESVVNIISDYRQGEIRPIDVAHVDQWIKQFPDDFQEPMLAELAHVFDKTYLSRKTIKIFLKTLIHNEKLCGDDPKKFWSRVNFLDIQQGGNSQREMLKMFDVALTKKCSLSITSCGSKAGPYVYLDDGIFNGGRVYQDIKVWLQQNPRDCEINIIVSILHTGGEYYAESKLREVERQLKIQVKLIWWRALTLESQKRHKNVSDILWPLSIPDNPKATAYGNYLYLLGFPPDLRSGQSIGQNKLFSTHEGRNLLEQQLLIAGSVIRDQCPLLPDSERPLGHTGLKTFGFGATTVTFRNCPNNCPLAFWVGHPWYPLFPRKTNTDTKLVRLIEECGNDGPF